MKAFREIANGIFYFVVKGIYYQSLYKNDFQNRMEV